MMHFAVWAKLVRNPKLMCMLDVSTSICELKIVNRTNSNNLRLVTANSLKKRQSVIFAWSGRIELKGLYPRTHLNSKLYKKCPPPPPPAVLLINYFSAMERDTWTKICWLVSLKFYGKHSLICTSVCPVAMVTKIATLFSLILQKNIKLAMVMLITGQKDCFCLIQIRFWIWN